MCGRMESRSINFRYVCGPSSISTPLIAMTQPIVAYIMTVLYTNRSGRLCRSAMKASTEDFHDRPTAVRHRTLIGVWDPISPLPCASPGVSNHLFFHSASAFSCTVRRLHCTDARRQRSASFVEVVIGYYATQRNSRCDYNGV